MIGGGEMGAADIPAGAVRRPVQIEIGGIVTAIDSPNPALTLALPPAVERFATNDKTADIDVSAHWRWKEWQPAGRLLFDSGGLWRLHEADGRMVWTFTSPRFGSAPYKTAVFSPDFSDGFVHLHGPYFDPAAPIYPLEYPLDELVITNWLALGRGVEVHACAVRDNDGAGYLFAGHSGAGKSTIAALWATEPGVTVLSDDRVILRKVDGEIWMYGTPWHGDEPLAAPARTRLTRGFFLNHGPVNSLTDARPAHVVAKLMTCSFPPFYSARALDFTMSFLTDASRCASFLEFGFVPDRRAIAVVRAIT